MSITRGSLFFFARRLGVLFTVLTMLAACGGGSGHRAGHGTLSGHLYMVGGPAPGTPRAVGGIVVATGLAGRYMAHTDADGRYTMRVPVGAYKVTGTSPQYNDGKSDCPSEGTVSVVRNRVSVADIYCQMP